MFSFLRPLLLSACFFTGTANLPAAVILIDFGAGANTTSGNWNNPVLPGAGVTGTVVSNLIDNTGASTGISLAVTDAFNGTNTDGSTTGYAGLPGSATRESWYGQTGVFSSFNDNGLGEITFSGLDVNQTYSFTLTASRGSLPGGTVRQTKYTLDGANLASDVLNVANNTSRVVTISNIVPKLDGTIKLRVESGETTDSAQLFFYLGAASITSVPEPGLPAMALLALGAGALLRRRRR
jgi:MYXO-CTERM domain-containing protein